ncbi:MAG TPA: hypothetical protein VEA59_01940 [Patescibacteria group bacterium]|nr:hypothetical protein [Patescibacteria group bacterium]
MSHRTHCETTYGILAVFCGVCGDKLPPPRISTKIPRKVRVGKCCREIWHPTGMRHTGLCHQELAEEGILFCSKCGLRIARVCKCGKQAHLLDDYCKHCGKELEKIPRTQAAKETHEFFRSALCGSHYEHLTAFYLAQEERVLKTYCSFCGKDLSSFAGH